MLTIGKAEKVIADLTEKLYDLEQKLYDETYAKNIFWERNKELEKENKALKLCVVDSNTEKLLKVLDETDVPINFESDEE